MTTSQQRSPSRQPITSLAITIRPDDGGFLVTVYDAEDVRLARPVGRGFCDSDRIELALEIGVDMARDNIKMRRA